MGTPSLSSLHPADSAIDIKRWPVLVIRIPKDFDDTGMERYLTELGNIYANQPEPYAVIIDARIGRSQSPMMRKMQTAFRAKWSTHVKTYCRGTAFVFNSKLVSGVIAAIFWLRPPDTETKSFTDFDAALAWAEQQLQLK